MHIKTRDAQFLDKQLDLGSRIGLASKSSGLYYPKQVYVLVDLHGNDNLRHGKL